MQWIRNYNDTSSSCWLVDCELGIKPGPIPPTPGNCCWEDLVMKVAKCFAAILFKISLTQFLTTTEYFITWDGSKCFKAARSVDEKSTRAFVVSADGSKTSACAPASSVSGGFIGNFSSSGVVIYFCLDTPFEDFFYIEGNKLTPR